MAFHIDHETTLKQVDEYCESAGDYTAFHIYEERLADIIGRDLVDGVSHTGGGCSAIAFHDMSETTTVAARHPYHGAYEAPLRTVVMTSMDGTTLICEYKSSRDDEFPLNAYEWQPEAVTVEIALDADTPMEDVASVFLTVVGGDAIEPESAWERTRRIKGAVLDCIATLAEMMNRGEMPSGIEGLGEVHDHMDGNALGGFCDDGTTWIADDGTVHRFGYNVRSDWSMEDFAEVHRAVDYAITYGIVRELYKNL